ncbi:hypothetical protein LRP88_07156 [Fusarium phalaenopsidis]
MTIPSSVKLRYRSSPREIQLPDRLSHSQGLLHHRYAPHAAAWLDVGVHRLECRDADYLLPQTLPRTERHQADSGTSERGLRLCYRRATMGRSLLEAANKPRNLVETQSGPLVSSGSGHMAMPTQERQKPNSGYICLHRVALRPSTHTGFMNAGGDAVEKRPLPLLENLV